MFLDRVTHFRIKLGDQGICHSPKKLKLLIDVPCVADMKVHVLSFHMILISSPWPVPTPSYPFRGNLGDQVKVRSPKKLKSLTEVPYVVHLKVQVLKSLIKVPNVAHLRVQTVSLNLNLVFSPQSVPRPSYTFRQIFGRSGKGSFAERA